MPLMMIFQRRPKEVLSEFCQLNGLQRSSTLGVSTPNIQILTSKGRAPLERT